MVTPSHTLTSDITHGHEDPQATSLLPPAVRYETDPVAVEPPTVEEPLEATNEDQQITFVTRSSTVTLMCYVAGGQLEELEDYEPNIQFPDAVDST